jgi:gliding motility-associated transport system ATP-binding protein
VEKKIKTPEINLNKSKIIEDSSIQLQNIECSFGSKKVIHDLSFSLKEGEIAALLGLNGAGKTTILRMITGLLSPTKGTITVSGLDPIFDGKKVKQLMGVLPEENILNLELTCKEHMMFVGKIRGLSSNQIKQRVDQLVEDFDLGDVFYRLTGVLSKGYRQRIALSLALFNDPPMILLDEPGSGLDPLQLASFYKLLRKISKKKTVLLSTHILPEVKKLSDKVVVISSGNLMYDGKYPGTSKLMKSLLGESLTGHRTKTSSKIEKVKENNKNTTKADKK